MDERAGPLAVITLEKGEISFTGMRMTMSIYINPHKHTMPAAA